MVAQVYRARKPKASPLWQCLTRHFDRFQTVYEERYQSRHGYLRPTCHAVASEARRLVIPEVVNKFMDCGDLERGLPFRFAPLLPYGQPVSLRSARPHPL